MRFLFIVSVLFVTAAVSQSPNNPFLRLEQTNANGSMQLVAKNISLKPIVAYVVVAEDSNHRSVWHGVYTGKDTLPAGETVKVGELPEAQAAKEHVFVDYVRLANGTTWGKATTDEAKEISARFQQQ